MTKDPIPPLTISDTKRFWAKVHKTENCWEWTASKCGHNYKNGGGYGQFGIGRKAWYAHRVSWTIENGPIPDGIEVLHHCDNQACVRPKHLFGGTQLDNVRDCIAKGRDAKGPAKANFGRKNGMSKPWVKAKQLAAVRKPEYRALISKLSKEYWAKIRGELTA